jgi:hypothetical protein
VLLYESDEMEDEEYFLRMRKDFVFFLEVYDSVDVLVLIVIFSSTYSARRRF